MQSTEFLRKLAHDLRSPISVVGGYVGARRAGTLSAGEEESYLEAVRASVDKLAKLADAVAERVGEGFPTEATSLCARLPPVREGASSCGSILVVDDNEGIRFQWRQILKSEPHVIIEAKSGEELLCMRLDFSSIRAAIVDYHYEGSDLNGLDVVEYLKRKKVPRIHLCTANYGDVKIREKAISFGAASVIPKPIPQIRGSDILK